MFLGNATRLMQSLFFEDLRKNLTVPHKTWTSRANPFQRLAGCGPVRRWEQRGTTRIPLQIKRTSMVDGTELRGSCDGRH